MTAKGNILKDSFYKERLSRTSNHIIKGYTTNFAQPTVEEESDTDAVVISQEYLFNDVGRSNLISNSIFLGLVRLHVDLPLPFESLYAHISVSLLYMYEDIDIENWRI
jgi:hypothetical protein